MWGAVPAGGTPAQHGFVIDGFGAEQRLRAGPGERFNDSTFAPDALGGQRHLAVTSAGPGEVSVMIGGSYPNAVSASMGWRTTGEVTLSWSGLNGLDLLSGGATEFRIGLITESQTGTGGIDLVLSLESIGGGAGSVVRVVHPGYHGILDFAFDEFTGVDFSRLGSIALELRNEVSPGLDMGITSFGLDCALTPIPEPGTWMAGLALVGTTLVQLLRRLRVRLDGAPSRACRNQVTSGGARYTRLAPSPSFSHDEKFG